MAVRTPTLVILRALKIGDFVTAVPALRALARAFPLHRRVLCAPAWLSPLVALTQAIDEIVDTAPLTPVSHELRQPAVAVNLHGRGPQSRELLDELEPARLVSFGNDDGPSWRPDEHERVRWCRLLAESGIPADPRDYRLQPPTTRPPRQAVGATVIHPGASSRARQWPPARFAAVARAEVAAGHRVVVTGDAADAPIAREVAARARLDDDAVIAGRTTLTELSSMVANAARVCSNDTGVAHLATAFGTPSVVLFGPVPPSEWGPPADDTRHRALWAGRRGDPHAPEVDAGLLRIEIDEVVDALASIPAKDW
jgi:ADP-heptose:LPS heptosyltransferase